MWTPRPLVTYHGTSAAISVDDLREMPSRHSNEPPFDKGIWVTTDINEATSYQTGEGNDKLFKLEIAPAATYWLRDPNDKEEARRAIEAGAKVLLNAEGSDNMFIVDSSAITRREDITDGKKKEVAPDSRYKWIDPAVESGELNASLHGRNMFMGTASAEPGLDLSAPVRLSDTEEYAKSAAYVGKTLPHKINLGPPRVYTLEAKNPDSDILIVSASEKWREANIFKSDADLEQLYRDLQEEAAAFAREQGYDFYQIREGSKYEIKNVLGEDSLFVANPDAVEITEEKVLGVLPGVREAPAVQDLVLYHGGGRKYGVIELEHRPTGEGEAMEPVPILRDTPAIWAKDELQFVLAYTISNRGGANITEAQVYYLDAPNALVGVVETYKLTQRQANATIKRLLDAETPPDVLKLYRNADLEFFISEQYEPGLVRVDGSHWASDTSRNHVANLPPVAVGGTDFDAPSDNFCRVMQAEAAKRVPAAKKGEDILKAEAELAYWTERCEESRPVIGKEGVKTAIAQIEKQIQNQTADLAADPYWIANSDVSAEDILRQKTINEARLRYWTAVRDNLEKTKSGYRLKDPAVLAKPEIQLLKSVYDDQSGSLPKRSSPRGRAPRKERVETGTLPTVSIVR